MDSVAILEGKGALADPELVLVLVVGESKEAEEGKDERKEAS